jgi:hypothetical protein
MTTNECPEHGMNYSDDKYLDVCHNIEAGLKVEYERNSRLTDERCSYALERAKAAVKQRFGYGANESSSVSPELQGIVDWCVAVATERINESTGPTLKEFLSRMDKVNRSIRRHARDGSRSYYEFIRPFFP